MNRLTTTIKMSLSRREFLKFGGGAMSALLLMPWDINRITAHFSPVVEETFPKLGRVTSTKIDGYKQPSFDGVLKKSFWRDLVLPITDVTIGDQESGHNRVWYQIENDAYVHSGDLQPVEVRTNEPDLSVTDSGKLAEISVPFSDAVWDIRRPDFHAYRLYYGTTYWVHEIVKDKVGTYWYRINDDKWKIRFFVNSAHMHIITPDEIAPISAHVPAQEKRIEIRLPEQIVIAYEYDRPVFMARTATGARFIDGDYRTPPGNYITNRKRPSRHMAAGDHAAPNSYDLPGVPWVSYLMENGISFHGTYWHNNFGRPRSHGCINLSIPDSRWIYRWCTPSVPLETKTINEKTGTMVHVIDKPLEI
jgi:lipoprotein-anchoring transpeptidase ErfK/SrfK